MNRVVSLGLVLLSVSGCSAMTLQSKYRAIGQYGTPQAAGPKVSPDQVQVFMQSSPPGFTLEKNELTVVEGFDHRVLGVVKVQSKGGYCDISDVGMKDVVALLQSETAARGGNAVIYAESTLSDPSSTQERCDPKSYGVRNHFGVGWAVVLGAGPAPAAKPAANQGEAPATPADGSVPAQNKALPTET